MGLFVYFLLKPILPFLSHALYFLAFQVWEFGYVLWKRPTLLPHLWRLWEWSWFYSPYRAAHATTLSSEYDLTYGELAIPTVDRILDQLNLSSHDHLVDLGSGRGRVVLLAAVRGIHALGIECVPALIQAARYGAGPDLPLAQFSQDNFLHVSLQDATVIWAVGTCWSETTRQQLLQKLLQLSANTWIISLTRPFEHPRLPTRHIVRGWTTWGRDRYYLQQMVEPAEGLQEQVKEHDA